MSERAYRRCRDGVIVSVGDPVRASNHHDYVLVTDGTYSYHMRVEYLDREYEPVAGVLKQRPVQT